MPFLHITTFNYFKTPFSGLLLPWLESTISYLILPLNITNDLHFNILN